MDLFAINFAIDALTAMAAASALTLFWLSIEYHRFGPDVGARISALLEEA